MGSGRDPQMISAVFLDRAKGLHKEENPASRRVIIIITNNCIDQWKTMIMTMMKKKPGKAGIEVVVDEHLAWGLSLRLPLLRQNREIRASLDSPLRVPRALPVPHQNHPLRRPDRRKCHRRLQLRIQFSFLLLLLHAAEGASNNHVSATVRCGSWVKTMNTRRGRTTWSYHQKHRTVSAATLIGLELEILFLFNFLCYVTIWLVAVVSISLCVEGDAWGKTRVPRPNLYLKNLTMYNFLRLLHLI